MKTNRKYLVRAFTKIAKRWEDSKKTPHNLRRYNFKNARQWGRMMADNYFFPNTNDSVFIDALDDMLEEAAMSDTPVTQADFDELAYEEILYW